jgi:hypothetical protein
MGMEPENPEPVQEVVKDDKPWLFKKGVSGNPSGKPKGAVGLTGALRKALNDGGRDEMIASMRKIMKDPNHRHFASLANHVFDRIEGKPTDARDRAMERMLGTIKLVHGRPNVPIPGLAQQFDVMSDEGEAPEDENSGASSA